MGVTDYGSQTISFKYNDPGRSEVFNKLNYKIIDTGFYEGGLLSYVDATTVQIAPFTVFIEDNATKVGIRLETAEVVNLTVSTAVPYIVIRFNWANLANNYADVLSVAEVDLQDDDLIAGLCTYDGNTLLTDFDYTNRTTTRIEDAVIAIEDAETVIASLVATGFSDQGGLIIPLYIYPADIFVNEDWNKIMNYARQYPTVNVLVVINPGNGPGAITDANYTVGIERLQGAGVKVIGYISTDYTNNALAAVKSDMDDWTTYYPAIDGFFYDEMTNAALQENYDYYSELNQYGKKELNRFYSVANPGVTTSYEYYTNECADIIINWENSTFPTAIAAKEDWDNGAIIIPKQRRGLIAHTQDRQTGLIDMNSMREHYGWFYVTDDIMPNPYDALPTYMEEQFLMFSTDRTGKEHLKTTYLSAAVIDPAFSDVPAVVNDVSNGILGSSYSIFRMSMDATLSTGPYMAYLKNEYNTNDQVVWRFQIFSYSSKYYGRDLGVTGLPTATENAVEKQCTAMAYGENTFMCDRYETSQLDGHISIYMRKNNLYDSIEWTHQFTEDNTGINVATGAPMTILFPIMDDGSGNFVVWYEHWVDETTSEQIVLSWNGTAFTQRDTLSWSVGFNSSFVYFKGFWYGSVANYGLIKFNDLDNIQLSDLVIPDNGSTYYMPRVDVFGDWIVGCRRSFEVGNLGYEMVYSNDGLTWNVYSFPNSNGAYVSINPLAFGNPGDLGDGIYFGVVRSNDDSYNHIFRTPLDIVNGKIKKNGTGVSALGIYDKDGWTLTANDEMKSLESWAPEFLVELLREDLRNL